jgi:hypothetical protein
MLVIYRSVSSLKNQMEKERSIHRQEYLRKMKENAFLLQVKKKFDWELCAYVYMYAPSYNRGPTILSLALMAQFWGRCYDPNFL